MRTNEWEPSRAPELLPVPPRLGETYGHASIQNAMWSTGSSKLKGKKRTLVLKLKNQTKATQAKLYVATMDSQKQFWLESEIHWNETPQFTFDINPMDDKFTEYRVDISDDSYGDKLKRLRLDLCLGETKGKWEIESIAIE